eukprot:scpid67297/ scgid7586/ 
MLSFSSFVGIVVLASVTNAQPWQMAAMCGGNQINPREQLCCNNEPMQHVAPPQFSVCCEGQPVDNRTEACCGGVDTYHPLEEGCCGIETYELHQEGCCGGFVFELGRRQCCGNRLVSNSYLCCDGNAVKVGRKRDYTCCGKKAVKKGQVKCCGNTDGIKITDKITKCCNDTWTYKSTEQSCCAKDKASTELIVYPGATCPGFEAPTTKAAEAVTSPAVAAGALPQQIAFNPAFQLYFPNMPGAKLPAGGQLPATKKAFQDAFRYPTGHRAAPAAGAPQAPGQPGMPFMFPGMQMPGMQMPGMMPGMQMPGMQMPGAAPAVPTAGATGNPAAPAQAQPGQMPPGFNAWNMWNMYQKNLPTAAGGKPAAKPLF